MKRNNVLSRGTALLLALALTLSCCPMSLAAGRSLTVRSLEDLTALARNCASDRYSDGLTVRLAADIDAEGAAVSLPLFLGTFEGQGHSISGLRLPESDSSYGLFSRIEAGAVVKNLTVEAEVTPSGEQSRVGGIAGRQNGYLASCENRGAVQGRKDVGGIVGQMVPDITLRFSSTGIDQLQSELNTLQGLIDRALSDAGSASDTVSGHVSRISDYAASASNSANDLAGEVGDFVNDNIETVNRLLLLAERCLAKASPILSDLSAAADSVSAAIAETWKLAAQLEDTLDYNDQALAQLQSFCAGTKAACDAILTGLDALETAFTLMKSGPAQPDTSALRTEVAALREAAVTLEATIGRAKEELAISGAVSPGTQAQLREDLLAVLDGCAYVTKALVEVVVNTDLSALRDQDLENLRQIAASLQTAMSSFRAAIAHLSAAMGHLQDFFGTLRAVNTQFMKVMNLFLNVLNDTQNVNYEDVFEDVSDESLQSGTRSAVEPQIGNQPDPRIPQKCCKEPRKHSRQSDSPHRSGHVHPQCVGAPRRSPSPPHPGSLSLRKPDNAAQKCAASWREFRKAKRHKHTGTITVPLRFPFVSVLPS